MARACTISSAEQQPEPPVASPTRGSGRGRGRARGRGKGRAQPRARAAAPAMEPQVEFDEEATANVARRVEMVLSLGGQGSDKRPRHSEGFSGASSGDRVYRSCVVTIRSLDTCVDIRLLDMVDFYVILGMDWLSPYHAILDCHAKTMTLALPGLPRLEWKGTPGHYTSMVIS
ncbi:uncharacterized protein [Nicotiana tomentosiformis]|uniref:uncharacterized protein n=1 Tax=Nicotiana tomentosiformis TaxID=4098 RepID=UPI00388CC43E